MASEQHIQPARRYVLWPCCPQIHESSNRLWLIPWMSVNKIHCRTNGGNISTDIAFQGGMVLTESKERFLGYSSNKERFIIMLSSALQLKGIKTHHASGDADCLILKTTQESARHEYTVLISEDTDLLVLLLFHCSTEHNRVFMKSSTSKFDVRIWDIKQVQGALGPNLWKYFLFAHAIGGCDTTSSLFGIGKSLPFKRLKDSIAYNENAHIFMLSSHHEQIIAAEEGALVVLYGGRPQDTLNKLRHVKYMQKLATSRSSLQPNKLPPTSAAAKFHSLRTYFQVQEWLNANHTHAITLDPEDWGWKLKGNAMCPIYTDIDVAPDSLLHTIRSNCKSDCTSKLCSCRRYGLVCCMSCLGCRGESCAKWSYMNTK